MTHTYTRGCFKLIFRKCLPIHTPYPPCRKHKQRHPHTNVLYRDCPPSRTFASSILQHPLLFLFVVFPALEYFFLLISLPFLLAYFLQLPPLSPLLMLFSSSFLVCVSFAFAFFSFFFFFLLLLPQFFFLFLLPYIFLLFLTSLP